MALTYTDQATLVANDAWRARVACCVADIARTQIRTLVPTDNNYTNLIRISVDAVRSDTYEQAFALLVAAGMPSGVTVLATPVDQTGSDTQLRAAVRSAFDALVAY